MSVRSGAADLATAETPVRRGLGVVARLWPLGERFALRRVLPEVARQGLAARWQPGEAGDVLTAVAAPGPVPLDHWQGVAASPAAPGPRGSVLRDLARDLTGVGAATRWGASAVLDALRLRALRGRCSAVSGQCASVEVQGFLGWLCAQGLPERLWDRVDAVEQKRVLLAAVAAGAGVPAAVAELRRRVPGGPGGAEEFGLGSALALRSVLDGRFRPELVHWLLPRPYWRRSLVEPWSWALLALGACRESGDSGGTVQFTAALVATVLRGRLHRAAQQVGVSLSPMRWGVAWKDGGEADAAEEALAWLHLNEWTPWRGGNRPWPRGLGGPDPRQVETQIAAWLLAPPDVVRTILLDDHLTLAAIHGFMGSVPSARSNLTLARRHPLTREARVALDAALARPPCFARRLAVHAPSGRWATLLQRLLAVPDVSLLLGAPPQLAEARYAATTRWLFAGGRMAEARELDTFMKHPELREQLDPYLLMPSALSPAFHEVAHSAARATGHPDVGFWLDHLEARCRQHLTTT